MWNQVITVRWWIHSSMPLLSRNPMMLLIKECLLRISEADAHTFQLSKSFSEACLCPRVQRDHRDIKSRIWFMRIVWIQIYPWHIGGALPHHELAEWKLLYHSSLHGQSFNTFLGHTSHTGMSASVLIIKDREGCLYGGYVSQPWERYSDFYRDMKSFLFQLNPNASIFRPTGANTDIQWVCLYRHSVTTICENVIRCIF
ncbi:TLD domain-containing protein 1 [Eutrema salsugineum]|uniref:TLD domain-containing protein 1 n=1 Tax=Eutrema salsugineum TaxID=72664 RepID=UPI000CED001C|nr:TLD domain-containing protein 1 [Eutrema salsugineum]